MIRNTLLSLCLCLCSAHASAGAWDVGAFDNDDALDWIYEITESSDIGPIRAALERVANSSGYLQSTDANFALAAAEVVAALNGNPNPMLPEEISEWMATAGLGPDPDLTALAGQAIERILDLETSELAQLWSDSPEMSELWKAEMTRLASRLE